MAAASGWHGAAADRRPARRPRADDSRGRVPAGAVLVDPSACAAMSAKAGCEAVLSLAVAGLTLMTVERALPKSLNQHRKSLASLAAGVACVAMACALNPPAVRYVVNPFDLAPVAARLREKAHR